MGWIGMLAGACLFVVSVAPAAHAAPTGDRWFTMCREWQRLSNAEQLWYIRGLVEGLKLARVLVRTEALGMILSADEAIKKAGDDPRLQAEAREAQAKRREGMAIMQVVDRVENQAISTHRFGSYHREMSVICERQDRADADVTLVFLEATRALRDRR